MANEAYRAVFLRVHPTGKMVLSLTTESDGEEARYAQLVADELGVPALDVKVVPGRHRPVRRRPRLQHRARRARTPAAIQSATGKILDKAQLLAGAALETLAGHASAGTTARSCSSADPAQPKTIADIALYAHGTGALPPGVEGGLDAQTVYRTRSRRLGVDRRSSTSSATFSAPNSAEYGFMPERGLRRPSALPVTLAVVAES